MEVVIPFLQMVQAAVELVQHGFDGCLSCFLGETVILAFSVDIHRHTLFHVASRYRGLLHVQGSCGRRARQYVGRADSRGREGGGQSLKPCAH